MLLEQGPQSESELKHQAGGEQSSVSFCSMLIPTATSRPAHPQASPAHQRHAQSGPSLPSRSCFLVESAKGREQEWRLPGTRVTVGLFFWDLERTEV